MTLTEKLNLVDAHKGPSNFDVAILGAGPAGLFAGIAALEAAPQARVVIFEHAAKPGRKLLATGGGQCNFTHSGSIKEFVNHYGAAGPSVRKVLYGMSNEALCGWMNDYGVASLAHDDGKIFPASLKASDVLNALRGAYERAGGVLMCQVNVTSIALRAGLVTCGVEHKRGQTTIEARQLIIATGGITYPKTGSDGSMVRLIEPLLKEYGVSVVPFEPALAPLYPRSYPFEDMTGVSLEARITAGQGGKEQRVPAKGLLFRSWSFSGPAAMDMSAELSPGSSFYVNFAPDKSDALEIEAARLFEEARRSSKETPTVVAHHYGLPKKLVTHILDGWGEGATSEHISKHYARDISKAECFEIAKRCLRAPFILEQKGDESEGMVSSGGFACSEIDFSTMALKKIPSISVAGECVDVVGDTGGYNLQWAFSSGYLAGKSALK